MNTSNRTLPVGEDPPAFGCVVYLRDADGICHARVANLDGLQIEAANHRAALEKLVPMFRQRVSEIMRDGGEVPWVDPPHPIADGEVKRFLPVHL